MIGGVTVRPVFQREVFSGPCEALPHSYGSPSVVDVLKSHL